MKLLNMIVQRKILTTLVTIFIIGIGSYTFINLEKELNPAVDIDAATIDITASNLNIEDVERKVTEPLEQTLQEMNGIKKISSNTVFGQSTLQLIFEDGKGKDLISEVESKTSLVLSDVPSVDHIQVNQEGIDSAFEFILDISDGELEAMTEFAKNTLQPRLEELPEVREVMFTGLLEHQVDIKFNHLLDEKGVTIADAITHIQQKNEVENLGELTTKEENPILRWDTTFNNIEDLENMQIPTDHGLVDLDDMATITINPVTGPSGTWKNGTENIIMVNIGRKENVSQSDMTNAVRKEIQEIRVEDLIDEFTLNEVIAHSDFVNDSINDVTKNILIGGIIAIVVLLLFLRNIRATFIIGLSIPTSIFLTVITMGLLDYTMNLLTLIGLGLGIGMMVDSSIVILEAIYHKKEQGLSNLTAVLEGTKEVSGAIIASVLTTIVVFLPIGLVSGESGEMMFILAMVVAITLISSVIIAFTLIPTLANKFMKLGKQKHKPKNSKLLSIYKNTVAWCIQKKSRSLFVSATFLIMFLLSFFLIPKIPMNIMPDMFNRYTEVVIDLEAGVSQEEKSNLVGKVSEQLTDVDDIKANYLLDFDDKLMANFVMTTGNKITKEQDIVTEEIIEVLRELEETEPIRGVERALDGVSDYPVEVNITGKEFSELKKVTQNLQADIESIDGIVGVTNTGGDLTKIKDIHLKEAALNEAQLSELQIKQVIDELLLQEKIGTVQWENEELNLHASRDNDQQTRESLLQTKIPTQDGEKSLASFITFKEKDIPSRITHEDGERYLSIKADIEGKDLGSVNKDVQKVINRYESSQDYSISLSGDLEEQNQLMNELLFVLGIALFLVFVVMAVQFNHFGQPLIVMAIIPITIIGVILGLFMTQADLNLMSGMGLVILVGIVLNNAILIIDRTNQLRREGAQVVDALLQAGENRIRPIFMTTLTTIGGMLPLALASGMSADYQAPLAIVIISGLLFSTLITLLLIPCVYRLFSKDQ